jgi:hypothetical protein
MKIFGIGACQLKDKAGDILDIKNLDISKLSTLNDEHSVEEQQVSRGMWSIIGSIDMAKKIFTEADIATPREAKCWEIAKAPFLYYEGTTIPNHPNAMSAEALILYANQNPQLPLRVGCSIEGLILKRRGPEGTPEHGMIDKASADSIAITIKPCQPLAKIFPYNDLQKSELVLTEGQIKSILNMPEVEEAIIERPLLQLKEKLNVLHESLKKSLDDVTKGGQCDIKCWSCNGVHRLFKSSHDFPNRCRDCGSPISMSAIWSALNQ